MVIKVSDVPEGPRYRVGISYNLKHKSTGKSVDENAEYDNIETIEAIISAIEKTGCSCIKLEANQSFIDNLKKYNPDIIFNIAEGTGGRGREAQITAILNFLNLPFTGSDETTLCISLDKTLSKKLVNLSGIKTPKYLLIHPNDDINNFPEFNNLRFPVIVKPNAEGSSKGIIGSTVAENIDELLTMLKNKFEVYNQSMLIEEFIKGREFTVGVMGNTDIKVFRPMEIIIGESAENNGYKIYSYDVKTQFEKYVSYSCPSDISEQKEQEIINTSERIYRLLECRDFARIDFILSEDNTLYFIEINPLPGLAPGYSDFPMLAQYNGVSYDELIKLVLNEGLKRNNLVPIP